MDLHIGTAITGTVTADLGFGPLLFRQWRLKRLSNSARGLLSDVSAKVLNSSEDAHI